ncbi:MAG: peptidoglycan-binding protein [Oscillospiraceae bacterium]|jgi:peptidoglycan hydrolase-like protein with peptidoglycan-binding domain|nr:peptidoglycan-binding protein [Oscillospiraceae bacterium]
MATPIIPNYITVHLGSPKTNARNVTLSFRDYVKNVTSSEIYPTWPEAALRANIYVITTFALNRVFTEHYRAQGYPFDITSSTSYDQAFVEGRDIFANISKLVDEQYNDYIVRRGQIQPMHSSYCNGTTSVCAGLSQWGSYYLANQGYTAYRILQYYYGNDIDLVLNAPQGNVRESYGGYLLRRGSIGEDVRTLQKMLGRISRNFPAVTATDVNTGILDADTEDAVRTFQKTFGLIADGIVGRETWYRIVTIYNAVKRLGELDSDGISASEAQELYNRNLKVGNLGQEVRILQQYLDFISLFYPSMDRVTIDGIFGAETERAVRAFQQRYGLTADGVVGRNTWNWLQSAYGELYNSLTPAQALPYYPNYALSPGNTGERVRRIQTWLNGLSRHISSLPSVTVDGVYGQATAAAVTAFQRWAQVPISGEIGPLTWNALQKAYSQYVG